MSNGLICSGRGTAGAKPELKTIGAKNTPLATVSVCFNRRVKRGEEWGSEPCWVNVQVWGKRAEYFAKDVDKGTQVFIEGYMEQRSWTDQETNRKRSAFQLTAEDYHLVARYNNGNGNGNGKNNGGDKTQNSPPKNDAPQGNGGGSPPEGSGPPVNQPTESEAPETDDDLPF